ncbi:MAG: hypothetical protein ACU0CA_12025 [Paracoccaceae bacterium]
MATSPLENRAHISLTPDTSGVNTADIVGLVQSGTNHETVCLEWFMERIATTEPAT